MVSVIIPAYNVEDYLARCLDSVCRQSYKNLEIIIIDDGSVDKTPEICDEYARRDSRIRVLHKKNAGVAAARNDALDMASGDMIAFADADDYYEPDMIERLYAAITGYDADMAVCGYYEEYYDRVDEYGAGRGNVVYNKTEAYKDYFKMGGRIGSGCWNKLFKLKAIGDIRYKKYRLGEDVEMLCRVIDNCDRIACIDYLGYHYIHRLDSATRKEFGEDNINMLHVADEMLEYIRIRHPELIKPVYAFHAAWHVAQIQVLFWDSNKGKYLKEKELIKKSIRNNMTGYSENPYLPIADMLFLKSFLYGFYRPVQAAYDFLARLKRKAGL